MYSLQVTNDRGDETMLSGNPNYTIYKIDGLTPPKVTINDSVSMNEFLDKYEILDQEGKIYTVKERE